LHYQTYERTILQRLIDTRRNVIGRGFYSFNVFVAAIGHGQLNGYSATRTRNNFASRWVAARRDEKCPLENGGLWPKPLFPSDSDFVVEQSDDSQHPPDDCLTIWNRRNGRQI
jgi:hypothetical protein